MQVINQNLIEELITQAKSSPRLRMNHNFHSDLNDKCQRMLNALEPGTIMPIHRHKVAEMYIVLQGSFRVMFYDNKKREIDEQILNIKNGIYGLQVPANMWHSIEVLESSTIMFEVKEGPYVPHSPSSVLE